MHQQQQISPLYFISHVTNCTNFSLIFPLAFLLFYLFLYHFFWFTLRRPSLVQRSNWFNSLPSFSFGKSHYGPIKPKPKLYDWLCIFSIHHPLLLHLFYHSKHFTFRKCQSNSSSRCKYRSQTHSTQSTPIAIFFFESLLLFVEEENNNIIIM